MVLLRRQEYLLPNQGILFCLRPPAFLKAGVVNNRAEIARRCGLSRARVTQVLKLLHLPEEIQDDLMALPPREQRLCSGRRLREVAAIGHPEAQAKTFEYLVEWVSEGTKARRRDCF